MARDKKKDQIIKCYFRNKIHLKENVVQNQFKNFATPTRAAGPGRLRSLVENLSAAGKRKRISRIRENVEDEDLDMCRDRKSKKTKVDVHKTLNFEAEAHMSKRAMEKNK